MTALCVPGYQYVTGSNVPFSQPHLRVHAHGQVVYEIAKYASCPVINALCNMEHPCQIMADLTTIIEHKGGLDGIKVAFVGDGNNNVTHSLALACAMLGVDVSVAAPTTDFMASEFSAKCTCVFRSSLAASRNRQWTIPTSRNRKKREHAFLSVYVVFCSSL